ncbi:TOMM precursor leader peptide-binding protein [Mycoavidus sp. B2-EB]|uniref:TOMM precursor leader peptide-binding protein n=1 Tax=Mycoavidus sp. B2-EB TaxID=2651972 RepID=UPI001625C051|nr:TOMM precursor leader peptide-binding protein [Mycoavidus sp. B2-EB]BBO59504.1 hypothetical protein MPB2EB_0623 [Mycoavidus sp. B2-EB]
MRPKIHPALRIYRDESGNLLVRGPTRTIKLEDNLGEIARFIHRCDGQQEWHVIFQDFSEAEQFRIEKALSRLQAENFLLDADTADLERHDLLYDCLDASTEFEQDTRLFEVYVYGAGEIAEHAVEALHQLGLRATRANPDHLNESLCNKHCIALTCSDYPAADFFLKMNRLAIQAKLPHTFVMLDQSLLRVGPLTIPVKSACYGCLEDRYIAHASHPEEMRLLHSSAPIWPTVPRSSQLNVPTAAHLAALQVARFAQRRKDPALVGEVIEFDFLTLQLSRGQVLKSPACTLCSDLRAVRSLTSLRAGLRLE